MSDKIKFPPNPVDGELFVDEPTMSAWKYNEAKRHWNKIQINTSTGVTIYSLNQQMSTQMPAMAEEEIAAKAELFTEIFDETNKYYMMLCKELSYYTVFVVDANAGDNEFKNLHEGVVECLKACGTIKSIDQSGEDEALEIWVTNPGGSDSNAYFLFPYDMGVCPIKER